MDTYTSFVSAFTGYVDNTAAAARIDTFLALVHAKLNRELRLEGMSTMSTITTVAGSPWIIKPLRYRGLRRLKVGTGTDTLGLDYRTLGEIDDSVRSNAQGHPANYTVLGDRFRLAPIPDGEYTVEIDYYQAQLTLSGTLASNAFLDEVPDLLMHGCLWEAGAWLKDVEMETTASARFTGLLNGILSNTESGRFPSGQLAARAV